MATMPNSVKVQRKLKRNGRPPIINAVLVKSITDMIATGAPMYTVAAANGIHRDTINDWLRKGAAAKRGVYKDFSVAVKEAAAKGQLKHFDNIRESGDGYEVISRRVKQVKNAKGELEIVETTTEQTRERQWTASAWILERMNPEVFGRKDSLKIGGDPAAPLALEVAVATPVWEHPEKLAEFFAALVEASLVPAIDVTPTDPKLIGGNGHGGNGANGKG